jgi:hypothetical protein
MVMAIIIIINSWKSINKYFKRSINNNTLNIYKD